MASYIGGALAGFALGLLAMLALLPAGVDPQVLSETSTWLGRNMGHSIWLFALVLILYCANLVRLRELIAKDAPLRQVSQLDQLSDVWIHVFIGIGVVWTAIGMRSALSTTLSVPSGLTQDAGAVLGRLVDGGILLALTTTIVGAIGGYLMRVGKTVLLGATLSEYYRQEERGEFVEVVERLARMEQHLFKLVEQSYAPVPREVRAHAQSHN